MKTFRTFIPTFKYVSVQYDAETQVKLREWCAESGFDLTTNYDDSRQPAEDFTFHSTIFYSSNKVVLPNRSLYLSKKMVLPVAFECLGNEQNIPVLKVMSDDLLELRAEYEEFGLEDTWPSYKPHISLSYKKETTDFAGIHMPTFDLTFDQLIVADQTPAT